jgi:hypothetical protein
MALRKRILVGVGMLAVVSSVVGTAVAGLVDAFFDCGGAGSADVDDHA